jgi:hypothetical protein
VSAALPVRAVVLAAGRSAQAAAARRIVRQRKEREVRVCMAEI